MKIIPTVPEFPNHRPLAVPSTFLEDYQWNVPKLSPEDDLLLSRTIQRAKTHPELWPVQEVNIRPQPTFRCEVGIDNCGLFEVCFQVIAKSRQGICTCVFGYDRNEDNDCVPRYEEEVVEMPARIITPFTSPIQKKIGYSGGLKEVHFEENEKPNDSEMEVEEKAQEVNMTKATVDKKENIIIPDVIVKPQTVMDLIRPKIVENEAPKLLPKEIKDTTNATNGEILKATVTDEIMANAGDDQVKYFTYLYSQLNTQITNKITFFAQLVCYDYNLVTCKLQY